MTDVLELLHKEKCSCVIAQGEDVRFFHQRGVADLYGLVCSDSAFLKGAVMADKVVGKAAAALMIKGELKSLYADVISVPALDLLQEHGVQVEFGMSVPHIINRTRTGWCPLEQLCYTETSVDTMFAIISEFIKQHA